MSDMPTNELTDLERRLMAALNRIDRGLDGLDHGLDHGEERREEFEGRIQDLETALTQLEGQIGQLKSSNTDLRAANADLRKANAQGLGDAQAIDAGLKASLDSLEAERAVEKAQLSALLAVLEKGEKDA